MELPKFTSYKLYVEVYETDWDKFREHLHKLGCFTNAKFKASFFGWLLAFDSVEFDITMREIDFKTVEDGLKEMKKNKIIINYALTIMAP